MRPWIDPELASYLAEMEEEYVEDCRRRGVTPFRCEESGCDNYIPCRKHPVES